ncbi:hypothetical protein V6x_44410 [Gimesia chilikensis]|uniref:DUF1598 domain-containing protein n=1 Tax=Gimesia chilikensis TaxID=2605989 RepID=A0A517WHJ0_9PLAN|nr:DUF1598 domain-containing protein [Gimesia chilikensis]QDU04711.1 hypothetical protein V6x_44410 [Gimesia chilikensis]
MRPKNPRVGSSVVSVLATIACLSIVLAVTFYLVNRQPQVTVEKVEEQIQAPAETPLVMEEQQEEVVVVPEQTPEPVQETPRVTPEEMVAAQLAAGEFGQAIETAETVADLNERTMLLKMVVKAQMDSGDFVAALGTINRIPLAEARSQAMSERAQAMSLAGGSQLADFTELIQLIQTQTSGLWSDTGEGDGEISQFSSGVKVDPNGLLHQISQQERNGQLAALGIKARQANLNQNVAQNSQLRLVSLTRLEQQVQQLIEEGRSPVETMKMLAGLTKVQYIFVYPEENEVVIAGPAEAWIYNEQGQAVGVESGRPVLQLDDLVTVLRTFSDQGEKIFGCSFDPRPEGLARVKEFVAQSNARGPLHAGGGVRNWTRQLKDKLGVQDITQYGVPDTSRVARVLIEADYRMKMIGIGKLDAGANIPSYFDLLAKENSQSAQKLEALRWWLTMKYDSVLHNPQRTAFELVGSSVLCQSENQIVTKEGQRLQTGQAEKLNREFAANFTKHYQELAQKDLVYADLQNIFDLALVAALMQNEQLANRAGWEMNAFAANGMYRPAEYKPAHTVETVVNHRVYNGKDVVVQVAGGVRVDTASVVKNQNNLKVSPEVGAVSTKSQAPTLPVGRWWWDLAN